MPGVLILGARAPAALDHARRFHRQGWTVHVADSIPCRMTGWSSAVARSHRIAPPRSEPATFVAGIDRIVRVLGIDLVLPTCEEVFHLARHRARLPQGVRVLADDFERLRDLHSKWRFLALARGCGATVPESALVADIAEARAWAGDAPVVLKPEYSRFGVHVRIHPHRLPVDAPAFEVPGPWVAQRFHAGVELCSYGIAERGTLLAHAVYRPAYRLHGSSSYYFDPCEQPAIRAFAEAFVRKTGYSGQIAFDWIVEASGAVVVLECNPRAVSAVHLFAEDDALPAALAGADAPCIVPSQPRPAMLAPLMISAGLGDALRTGTLGTWRADWRRARDVLGVRGDRRPLAGALLDIGAYAALALRRSCSLREVSTSDIAWDGEALPSP